MPANIGDPGAGRGAGPTVGREPGALGAQHARPPVGGRRSGSELRRSRRHPAPSGAPQRWSPPGSASLVLSTGPRSRTGPGQGERAPMFDLDGRGGPSGSAVLGESNAPSRPGRGSVPQDRPDVGVVDDVFQDDERRFREGRRRVCRGSRCSEASARDARGSRSPARRDPPSRRRPGRRATGPERPGDPPATARPAGTTAAGSRPRSARRIDLLPLSDEQSVLGLEVPTQEGGVAETGRPSGRRSSSGEVG